MTLCHPLGAHVEARILKAPGLAGAAPERVSTSNLSPAGPSADCGVMLQVRWSINAGNPNKRKTLACAYDPIKKRQHNFGNEAKEVVQQTPSSQPAQTAKPAAPKPAASKPSKKRAPKGKAASTLANSSLVHADTSVSIGAFLDEFVSDDSCLESGDFCAGFFADDAGSSLPMAPPELDVESAAECDPLEFLVSSHSAESLKPDSPDVVHSSSSIALVSSQAAATAKSLPPSPNAGRTLAKCGLGPSRPTLPGMTSMASMASLASLNTQVGAGSETGDSGPSSPKCPNSPAKSFVSEEAEAEALPLAPLPEAAEAPALTSSELIKELSAAVAPAAPAAASAADDFFHLVGGGSESMLDNLCDFDHLPDLHVFGGHTGGAPAAASAEDFALAGATSCDLPAEDMAQLTSLTAPSLPMLAGLTFTGFDSPLKKRKAPAAGAKPRAPKMTKAAKLAEAAAEAEAKSKTEADEADAMPPAPPSPATTKPSASGEACNAEAEEGACCVRVGEPREANTTSPAPCDEASKPVQTTPAGVSKKASSKKGMKWSAMASSVGTVAAPVAAPVMSTMVTSVTTTTTTTTTVPMPTIMGVQALSAPVPVGVPVQAPVQAPPASRGMQFTWQPLKIAGMRGK